MAALVLGGAPAALGESPLIPRELLLGDVERASPRLSPDGKRLAWLSPDERNVSQLWVKRVGNGGRTPEGASEPEGGAMVSAEKRRGVRSFAWTEDSSGLLFSQDEQGDERPHVSLLDLGSRNVRDLTPWQSVRAALLANGPRFAGRILVEANVRDRRVMDVWRIDLKTGAAELDTPNPGDVTKWLADATLTVRAAVAVTREGGTEVRFRDTAKSLWRSLIAVGPEESVDALGFTDDGKALYVTTSIDADTGRLVEKSLRTGAEREVAYNPSSDVLGVLGHPTKRALRAVAFGAAGRRVWTAVDSGVRGDLETLAKALTGDFGVESMDAADARWVVSETRDVGPLRFWLWDRRAKRLEPLFSTRPRLEGQLLSPMTPVVVPARDGLELSAYLTRPLGVVEAGPLVLQVHSGPFRRDEWGYQGGAQLMANRGYSVLQVNFRGSTGFGKRLLNAGNREWGLTMQTDLLDAVEWAVREGIADPKRLAIVGRGYGGYAVLAGLAFTPDTFACGVDEAGPSNLFTFLAWAASLPVSVDGQLLRRLGDPSDPSNKARLTRASPLFSVDQVKAPLLIGHGAADLWVRSTESEQLVAALEGGKAKVTYVLYPDEGHGFERVENRLDFYGRMERFLAQCLHGRAEPLPGEGRVPGSTAVEQVLGNR